MTRRVQESERGKENLFAVFLGALHIYSDRPTVCCGVVCVCEEKKETRETTAEKEEEEQRGGTHTQTQNKKRGRKYISSLTSISLFLSGSKKRRNHGILLLCVCVRVCFSD